MRAIVLVAILVRVAAGHSEETPTHRLDPEQVASCVTALAKDPRILPRLAAELLSFLKRQNSESSLADAFGEVRTVAQAGDALIIEQKSGLKFLRQHGLNDSKFTTLALKGREVVQFYVQNDYFVIVTKEVGGEEHYLQVVDSTPARVAVSRRFNKLQSLKFVDLPRQEGRVIFVGGLAVFIFDPSVAQSSGPGKARISVLDLAGTIEGVAFDETLFGDLPIARVRLALAKVAAHNHGWVPGALLNAHDRSRKENVYVDYSATEPYQKAGGTERKVPDTPVVMALPASAKFRAFPLRDGKISLVHFFWNHAYWNGLASVATFVYKSDAGWSKETTQEFGMRIELDTISPGSDVERYRTYKMSGVQKMNAVGHDDFEILMPSFRGLSEMAVILKNPRLLYKNKKNHESFFQADHRSDRDREFSSTLGWRNLYMNEFGVLRGFLSSYPFAQVSSHYPVEPERLTPGVSLEHDFLFAKIESGETRGYLVFSKYNGDTLWVPRLKRIQVLAAGKERRILFWGEQTERARSVPTLGLYDVESRLFELVEPRSLIRETFAQPGTYFGGIKTSAVQLRRLLGPAVGSEKMLIWADTKRGDRVSDFNVSTVFGSGAKPENIVVRMHPEFNLVTIDLKRAAAETIRYWVDLNHRSIRMFRNHFEIQVDKIGLSDHHFMVVAAETSADGVKIPEDEDLTEGASKKRPKSKSDATALAVLHRAPDGALVNSSIPRIPGQVERIVFRTEGQKIYAVGTAKTSGLIKDTKTEFIWPLGETDLKNVIYNKVPTPLYDDEDSKVFVSRGSSESHPKVFYYRKGQLVGHEIELKYAFKEAERTMADRLMELFFGEAKSGNSNTQEIAKIEKEGDLLFVTTEASLDRCSITYIYNLRRKALEVAVPNFKRSVDLGKYRFYVGEASSFFPTIVAVVKGANHSFLTHFDFGQVELDTTSPESITSRGEYIVFKTRGGSERIYDTRYNYFLGTIPKDVKDKLRPIEGSLGHSANDRIFQTSIPNLQERDDAFADLQRNFPMRASKSGSQNLMLILPSGAGGASILNHFMLGYVVGRLSPKPQYRAIFFEVDGLDASADTKFRGQVADKYKKLREVAQDVRGSGYRLIVILKRADQLLPDGEVTRSDTEGDIFGNLASQMNDGDFDVIATSTPGGFEQIQRRKPRFAGKFQRIQRVPAMSPEQAVRGVDGYLKEEFGDHPPLSARQLDRVVNRLARLNVHRALPGPAFTLVKQLVPGLKTTTATDEEIDSALAQQTGVPRILLDKENVAVNIRKMRDYLNSRVKGIPEEINQITRDLFAFALDNNRPDWPISRIMAMGATGTGKGELIKGVVSFLCQDEKTLLKISGEDWKEPGHAMRLKTLIVSHRNQYPFNFIQLDEWDKMHPENQDVMLSMGDGEIIGPKGEKMSMSLSVLYATSNLGADKVKQAVASLTLGFRNPDPAALAEQTRAIARSTYLEELEKGTRDEVRNRFDRVFIFPHLTKDIARVILDDYLNGHEGTAVASVRARYAARNIILSFDQSLIDRGMTIFFDERLGARRVAVNIENFVKDFLTEYEFSHAIPKGIPLRVGYDGAQFKIYQSDIGSAEAI